jgi:hypothetical protein
MIPYSTHLNKPRRVTLMITESLSIDTQEYLFRLQEGTRGEPGRRNQASQRALRRALRPRPPLR